MKTFKVIFSTVSIVLVLCLLVGGVYFNYFLGQYNLDDIKNHILFDVGGIQLSDDEKVDPDTLPDYTFQPGDLLSSNDIINILLVGSDAYTPNERGRSDSIMIATIDMKHNKLKLTSFLRDTWLQLPGQDSKGRDYGWNRINTSYSYGDAAFLMKTIEHNFSIKLDKFAVVNFELFKEIINTIGGIDINLSAEEAAYIRGRRLDEAGPNRKNAKTGVNRLDGPMALEFARARHAGPFTYTNNEGRQVTVNNDFARSARQRYVIETIFNKMKNEDLSTLLEIAKQCMNYTRTNVSIPEMTSYLTSVLSMGVSGIQTQQIPATGKYEDKKMSSGAQVLYLSPDNLSMNSQILKEFIFEE